MENKIKLLSENEIWEELCHGLPNGDALQYGLLLMSAVFIADYIKSDVKYGGSDKALFIRTTMYGFGRGVKETLTEEDAKNGNKLLPYMYARIYNIIAGHDISETVKDNFAHPTAICMLNAARALHVVIDCLMKKGGDAEAMEQLKSAEEAANWLVAWFTAKVDEESVLPKRLRP